MILPQFYMTNFILFRKPSHKRSHRFVIRKNKRGSRNGHLFEYAKVFGNCCWKMCNRRKDACDELSPGEEKQPNAAYAYKIQARPC